MIYLPVYHIEDIFDFDNVGVVQAFVCFSSWHIIEDGAGHPSMGNQSRFLLTNGNCICRFIKGRHLKRVAEFVASELWVIHGGNEIQGAVVMKPIHEAEAESIAEITGCPIFNMP